MSSTLLTGYIEKWMPLLINKCYTAGATSQLDLLHGNERLAVELSHVGLVSWKCTQVADLQYSDATY